MVGIEHYRLGLARYDTALVVLNLDADGVLPESGKRQPSVTQGFLF